MTTSLIPIDDCTLLLTLSGIGYRDLIEVCAWMYACDMPLRERHRACCTLMTHGTYAFCNTEYRIEVRCIRDNS